MEIYFTEELGGPTEEDKGINDSGIQTFAHDRKNSVARETSQNSNDAGVEALGPVQISYDVIMVPQSEFPDHTNFKTCLENCIKYNKSVGRSDAVGVLEESLRVLTLPNIPVLLISDHNTTGVSGSIHPPGPLEVVDNYFHTLVVSEGVSAKPDEYSGGSFGIGKNAAFSATSLRTVFYSTQFNSDPATIKFLAMGKSIFTNFYDKGGKYRKHKGMWGEKSKPIKSPTAVPEWLRRKKMA